MLCSNSSTVATASRLLADVRMENMCLRNQTWPRSVLFPSHHNHQPAIMVFLPQPLPEQQQATEVAEEEEDEEEERQQQQQLSACQISFWYPLFAHPHPQDDPDSGSSIKNNKKKCTFRTVILDDLPDPEFVNYLNADQVILPRGVKTSSALLEGASSTTRFGSSDEEDDEDDDDKQEDEEEEEEEDSDNSDQEEDDDTSRGVMMHEMQELSRRIEDAIRLLGGAVMPKLNWSSPKDAVWMNGGTSMECRRAGDVLLLLKSSDFIAHDLTELQRLIGADGRPPTLALRKWANLHPSQEYRCFCRRQSLIAICQRHHTDYWPHVAHDLDHRRTIQQVITTFFHTVILTCSSFPLSSFVFDVYVDRKHKVWLVDFNVWGSTTDALLFDWDEFLLQQPEPLVENTNNGNDETPVPPVPPLQFRVVEHARHVLQAHPLSNYKAPVDLLDLAGDSRQFREFMSLCERPTR
jgi:D123